VIDHRTENVFERARQIAGPRLFDAILDTIGARNGVDNLRLLAPEGGVAFIAGLPDLSRIDELPYSVAIHDIGLGGVLIAPQFRHQQEDLAKMASEMISLVERVEIRSTVSQVISLDEIPQSLATLAEGHVRGKIVATLELTQSIRDRVAHAGASTHESSGKHHGADQKGKGEKLA
jgi:NADPH2:quinone reductase